MYGGWDYTGPHDRQDQIPGHVDLAALNTVTHIGYSFNYDPGSALLGKLENALLHTLGGAFQMGRGESLSPYPVARRSYPARTFTPARGHG